MQLTEDQKRLVERIEPFIPYILKHNVPYIPSELREDCYSVACLTLCECAIGLESKKDMWLPNYAISRIRDEVIQFILREQQHNAIVERIDAAQDDGENHIYEFGQVESGEEIVVQQNMCDLLFQTVLKTPEERLILQMFMTGYSMNEISKLMQISCACVSRFVARIRQHYISISELSEVS